MSVVNDFEDGAWREKKFQRFVWDNVALTALSHRERQALADSDQSRLITAAKNLRLTDAESNDPGKGSELAEILLYGLMKQYYGALPVVPKIFYKQNAKDYAKGADSVHIVVEGGDDFSLWLGETKFYNSLENGRLDSIVASVGESLMTNKLRKENSIITSVSDLDEVIGNEELRERIKNFLSERSSIDDLKLKLHIPILILYECEITARSVALDNDYREAIIKLQKERAEAYYSKQVSVLAKKVHLYSEITFHLILFPVPAKQPIVKRFISNVDHYRAQ